MLSCSGTSQICNTLSTIFCFFNIINQEATVKFEKEYREAWPETIGEKDTQFDMLNYSEYLENCISGMRYVYNFLVGLLEIREAQNTIDNKSSFQFPKFDEILNGCQPPFVKQSSRNYISGQQFESETGKKYQVEIEDRHYPGRYDTY